MFKNLLAFAAITLFASGSFALDCSISKYVSKDSAEYETLKDDIEVVESPGQKIGETEPTLADGYKYLFKLSGVGLFYVEVRDVNDETLFITTTDASSPLGIEIPAIKHILTCNPHGEKIESSMDRLNKSLKVNPRAYGESMRRLDVNPQAYGAYIRHMQAPAKYFESLKFLAGCSEDQMNEVQQLMASKQNKEALAKIRECSSK